MVFWHVITGDSDSKGRSVALSGTLFGQLPNRIFDSGNWGLAFVYPRPARLSRINLAPYEIARPPSVIGNIL